MAANATPPKARNIVLVHGLFADGSCWSEVIARLQAANSSGHPILLRTTSSAGHGIGTALDEQIEQDADLFSFLFDQLGIKYVPVAK